MTKILDDRLWWWGYQHVNGEIQVKRFFDARDIRDAEESNFVKRVFTPFTADSREDALHHINLIKYN